MNTAAAIETLRREFSKLTAIDPCGQAYAKLCDILDRADDDTLKAASSANIKFVSSLARNRLLRRGLLTVPR